MLELRTEESGYSSSALLPTPDSTVSNDGESLENWQARKEREKAKGRNGNGFGTPLAIAVRLLPTPTQTDSRNGRNKTAGRSNPESNHHDGTTLCDMVRLLPTPTARDGKGGNTPQDALVDKIKLLPTPTSADGDQGEQETYCRGNPTLLGASTNPPSGAGNASSEDQRQDQLTIEEDSALRLSSGSWDSPKAGRTESPEQRGSGC
jgi:hypothetical protein